MAEPALLGGDFQILRALGRGGMASVYLAEQLSTGRLCAVKTMLPGSDVEEEEAVRRFWREPRVLMRLPSDHVAQVIRVGETDGTLWFAMELLDGETLQARIFREDHLEPGEAFSILTQVCSALDAAHRRGIIHCDINPDNIYLSRSVRGETIVKVLGLESQRGARAQRLG